jgi:hypothetical protein
MRTRCYLSLALFRLDGKVPDAAALIDSVATCVRRNMRETDAVANLGDGTVAVLLADTSFEGGSTYAQRILNDLPRHGVSARVESYPSPVFDDICAGRLGSLFPVATPVAQDPNATASGACPPPAGEEERRQDPQHPATGNRQN